MSKYKKKRKKLIFDGIFFHFYCTRTFLQRVYVLDDKDRVNDLVNFWIMYKTFA